MHIKSGPIGANYIFGPIRRQLGHGPIGAEPKKIIKAMLVTFCIPASCA
jgi:hypothetical protein